MDIVYGFAATPTPVQEMAYQENQRLVQIVAQNGIPVAIEQAPTADHAQFISDALNS